MKKLSIFATMALGLLAFTSCESDRDDNPILSVPGNGGTTAALELLDPEIGNSVVDLKHSESVQFKVKAAPNYGAPTQVSYWMQTALNEADFAAGKFESLDTKGRSITYDALRDELDLSIMMLKGWEEESQVDTETPVQLYVRMVASIKAATDSSTYVYSNVKSINVYPFFIKEALPELWYMTGDCVGYADWSNGEDKIGEGMIPFYVKSGESYNRFTGKGTVEYVGYFHNGQYGFKLIAPKGLVDWMYGISGGSISDGEGYKSRDGGDDPGNITVSDKEAGYYRLTLNTTDEKLTIEKYEEEVKNYTSMKLGDKEMQPMTKIDGVVNHDWFLKDLQVTADTQLKFVANDGTEFGTETFPYGIATDDGNAITVKAVKTSYKVYFNDITGAFMFVEQK